MSCGYCTDTEHRRPNCPTFHGLRRRVWNGHVDGRKRVIDTLTQVGLGPGAIFEGSDYKGHRNFMTLSVESRILEWRFFNYKFVKYSKQVNLISHMHNDSWESYNINCMDMSTGTPVYYSFTPYQLFKGSVPKDKNIEWGSFRVLSPSHDEYAYDESLLTKQIYINSRLAEREEKAISKNYPQIQERLLDPRW